MNKFIKSLLWSILLSGASIGFAYFIRVNYFNEQKVNVTDQKCVAIIKGAVENPGSYFFEKNSTIRQIIFKSEVKNDADIYQLSLETKQDADFEIFVPYKLNKKPKLKYSQIISINQLKAIGIRENIAKILLKNKNEIQGIPTWEDIDRLPGIGEKTLIFLKENIELL